MAGREKQSNVSQNFYIFRQGKNILLDSAFGDEVKCLVAIQDEIKSTLLFYSQKIASDKNTQKTNKNKHPVIG